MPKENPKKYLFIFVAGLLITILALLLAPTARAGGLTEVTVAPINPDFLRYLQNKEAAIQLQRAPDERPGLIPSPLDLSHLKGESIFPGVRLLGLPVSYDLRSLGKVTPVKNQGSCGDCWAFATYGSLESILMPSEVWDFSENNLKNTHGFDLDPCDGGNADISTAYLARWSGPVKESDDTYILPNPVNTSPSGLQLQKHIQEVFIIPDRAGPFDNDNIKQTVMTYGALFTTMYWSASYYNATYKSYYYNGTSQANHAVTIVGWDDNKVIPSAPGNGAFIIKNSWGTSFGENGYFYISYYDSNIGNSNYLFDGAEPLTSWSRAYQYDPLGWMGSYGYGSNAAWFANIFTAAANEQLAAVSFYTASPNSTYEVYVYSNVSSVPTSGSLSGNKTGAISLPGYHTISLEQPVPLSSGQRFSIVVKLTTPGYNYPIPLEYPYSGYSSAATAHAGESYISRDGALWSDLTTSYANANVCLKAFTTVTDNSSAIGAFNSSTGTFYLKNANSAGPADVTFRYGPAGSGWKPVTGDWDGDGKRTVGLYNPATGTFYLKNTNAAGAADITFAFISAGSGWKPVTGDWDGDGIDSVGLFDPVKGIFYLKNTNGAGPADLTFRYGPAGAGWIPIAGDWNGDGIDTIGLYNPATRTFYLKNTNSAGPADITFTFSPGGTGLIPIAGDWDGDGIDTVGLFDPVKGIFYLKNTNAAGPADLTFRYGPAGALWAPVAGNWDGLP